MVQGTRATVRAPSLRHEQPTRALSGGVVQQRGAVAEHRPCTLSASTSRQAASSKRRPSAVASRSSGPSGLVAADTELLCRDFSASHRLESKSSMTNGSAGDDSVMSRSLELSSRRCFRPSRRIPARRPSNDTSTRALSVERDIPTSTGKTPGLCPENAFAATQILDMRSVSN